MGLIHEMFVREGRDWFESWCSNRAGRGGTTMGGGMHEIVIARRNDLQERKRLLIVGADALAVLLGRPGTWDEVGREKGALGW